MWEIRDAGRYRVSDRHQIKTVGRGGHAPGLAIARREHLAGPSRLALARANSHQNTGDITHHVLQKGIGVGADMNKFPLPRNFQ